MCCEDILSSRERLFDSSIFFLKIIYKQSKMHFFTQFPILSRKLKADFKAKKIHFSSITQMGIFSKIILNRFFFLSFFCEILMLQVCPGLIARLLGTFLFRYLFVGIIITWTLPALPSSLYIFKHSSQLNQTLFQ